MSRINAINEYLARRITDGVSTMWCAYAFAFIALTSLRDNIRDIKSFIAWLSSQFLQLVLLSVVMVGDDVRNRRQRQQITESHDAAMAMLAEIKQMHAELHAKVDKGNENAGTCTAAD